MIRDRRWREDAVRGLNCLCTGLRAKPHDPVEAAHIGTAGKAMKSSDDEIVPLLHSVHAEAHQLGEMTVLRRRLLPSVVDAMGITSIADISDADLREALRRYAKEEYQQWLRGSRPFAAARPSYLVTKMAE